MPDAWAVEIEAAPSAFQGRTLLVEGQLLVDGERSRLSTLEAGSSVEVIFGSTWTRTSSPQAVWLLRKMQLDSRPAFPYRGFTIIRLRTQRAWVAIEGHVETNDIEYNFWPATHRFVVNRVLTARPMARSEPW